MLKTLDFERDSRYNICMANNEKWTEIVAEKDARIAELEALVKFYEEQFRLSKQRQFGASSEKGLLPEQFRLDLFNEAENTTAPNALEIEEITYKRKKRTGKREDDLSSLPVEIVEHKLPEDARSCPECDGNLHQMGYDTRKELKIIPASVKVVEHRRAVYSCRNCEKNSVSVPIVKAVMPEPIIKGSLASPSAVAHIMTQKYVMHAPLYRQSKDWERRGVKLSRQTMANWVIRCSEDWLRPLYDRMRKELKSRKVLHADESRIQVLKEPGRAPTTDSFMWLYRTSGDTTQQIVLFDYQPSRSGEHPKRFLTDFKGILHADGYQCYHSLPEITVVGCFVHARRRFKDAFKVIPANERLGSAAAEALRQIGVLFHLEEQWEPLRPEERYRLRLKESKPLAEKFFNWLETLMFLPKSAMGTAIQYALNQREWLMNVYLDGRAEMSNNKAENALRPLAQGRRNWLFADTVKGAEASAIAYSVIETSKANGLKPFEYLEFLLETLPDAPTGSLDSLLPWGDAVPESCRMPVQEKEVTDAKEERDKVYDGFCAGIFERGA